MFETSPTKTGMDKKKKALLYAAILTLLIALIYILIYKGKMYRFSGVAQDFRPLSSLLKDTPKVIGENVEKGTEVIKNKKD